MVKVSIEVRSGAARFRVAVQARSIRRAISIVGNRYPDREIGARFPIDRRAPSSRVAAPVREKKFLYSSGSSTLAITPHSKLCRSSVP
jgi:hypothetical protein